MGILDQLRGAPGEVQKGPGSDERGVPRVGSYARISDAYEDAVQGVTTEGVERQLRANEHIAKARGWEIAERYVDNDVSAYRKGVVRDEWERLIKDLREGAIDGIVCYNLDRFARKVSDLERAIEIYDESRARAKLLFATAEGDLDLSSDDGLTLARVMVVFANKASRDTSRRTKAKHRDIRDKGKKAGGVTPFGFSLAEGRLVHDPREATAIRDAIKGVTTGTMGWSAVARMWNERGLKTQYGNEWLGTSVKPVLMNPRNAGWRTHQGRIAVHSETGRLVRGDWDPIVSDEDYEALLVAVEGRTRQTHWEGKRKHFLSGILRCAECGAKMAGTKRSRDGYRYYICLTGNRGCGKVSVSAARVEGLIEDLMLPFLEAETIGGEAAGPRPHDKRVGDLEAQKDRLLAAYHEGQATSETVFPVVTEIERDLDLLRHEQAEWARDKREREATEGITPESWKGLDAGVKHRFLERYIEAIYVDRTKGGGWDPGRVQPPVWRTPPSRSGRPSPTQGRGAGASA